MAFDSPTDGAAETGRITLPAEPPWMLARLDVYEAARLAQRWSDALLAILSTRWEGGETYRICPCCRASFNLLSHQEQGPHRPGCAWLIAAQACGIA